MLGKQIVEDVWINVKAVLGLLIIVHLVKINLNKPMIAYNVRLDISKNLSVLNANNVILYVKPVLNLPINVKYVHKVEIFKKHVNLV